MPMTLWSVEKMYFRQKPKLLVVRGRERVEYRV